jgi:hypothetical protein
MIVFLTLLAVSGVLGLLEYARRRALKTQEVQIGTTDLSHAALAVLAANALTSGPPGIAASSILSALYVLYQWAEYIQRHNTLSKDIATYLAVYAATVAAKLGLSLTGLS